MPSSLILIRQEKEEGNGDYWVDEKERQAHLTEKRP